MPKNVFVLSPGRAGSMTFAHACETLENYTSGHETLIRRVGEARLAYPENHIEADNRLTWHLGQMAQKYDGQDVLYVHLRRDPEKIAQSYYKRWKEIKFSAAIIPAFANGIIMREKPWPEEKRLEVCRYYVDTVIANIDEFIKTRPHMTVELEDGGATFNQFLDRIGAQGDLEATRRAWSDVQNDHAYSVALNAQQGAIRKVVARIKRSR
jgi:hypothetical protein